MAANASPSISGQREWYMAISSACSGCAATRVATASAKEPPASRLAFHSGVQTSARNDSIAATSSPKTLRYKCRGFQSMRTPPRSNTTVVISVAITPHRSAGHGPRDAAPIEPAPKSYRSPADEASMPDRAEPLLP